MQIQLNEGGPDESNFQNGGKCPYRRKFLRNFHFLRICLLLFVILHNTFVFVVLQHKTLSKGQGQLCQLHRVLPEDIRKENESMFVLCLALNFLLHRVCVSAARETYAPTQLCKWSTAQRTFLLEGRRQTQTRTLQSVGTLLYSNSKLCMVMVA